MSGRRHTIRAALPRIVVREGGKLEAWEAGASGQNHPFKGVWIWSGIDCRAAVAAQELYEWGFRMLAGLCAAAIAAIAVAVPVLWIEGWLWQLAPLAAWAAFVLVPQLHVVQRRKELKSHEIEAQAAGLLYGVDVAAYRIRETGDHSRPEGGGMIAYPWLKNMTEEEIRAGMERHAGAALAWIARHDRLLRKIERFQFEPLQERMPGI